MEENSIIDELMYDRASGSILYKGVRYLLIRPETITGFQKAVEKQKSLGEDADEIMFAGGFAGGSLSSKKFKELNQLNNHDIIDFMMKMGSRIGWGNFILECYDAKKKVLRVSVTHSPFAESYGRSAKSVCHLIRGVLAGMAAVVFDTDCISSEIECVAKGDRRCLFVIEGT
jgi:predicted hydrocarbon binding protein